MSLYDDVPPNADDFVEWETFRTDPGVRRVSLQQIRIIEDGLRETSTLMADVIRRCRRMLLVAATGYKP